MQLKRIAAMGVTAALALTLLAGCTGGGTSSSSSGAPADSSSSSSSSEPAKEVTLKVALWDVTTNPADKNAIDAFMAANPNIKVELMDIPSADYVTKLTTMLNGSADLDAFFIKEADGTKAFADKGQLLDLTEYIKKDGIDTAAFNGMAENFNYDGKQYALPMRTDYYVMYYNKDLFDAKNLEYPSNDWTWAEFEELAGKLADSANGVYGAHFHTWNACVQNWGVQDGKHTIMDYSTGYDFFKPYYEMALRMQDNGSIQSFDELKSGNIHYSGPFPQGKVAMLPMGTWFMATMIQKVKDGESTVNWGVATLPHAEGVEAGYTVGSCTPIAISANSKNADAAWELVKFMTGKEGAASYAKDGYLPSMSDDSTIATVAAMEGMPEGVVEALQVKHISPDRPVMDFVGDVNQMLGEQHGMIMLGESTVDEGLAEMAKQSEEIQKG